MSDLTQWPTLLDMSREECRRVLRRLELAAYSGVVSAFRGQGELSSEKHRLLTELAAALGMSADRHRAEVRRAANDDTLNTIAHRLAGAGSCSAWAAEGRRLVPPLPRGSPVTPYTAVADAARDRADRRSGRLLPPAETKAYSPVVEELPLPDLSTPKVASKRLSPPPPAATSQQSPLHKHTPGVNRHASKMAVQVDDDIQARAKKRRRSSSLGESAARIHPPPLPPPLPPPPQPRLPRPTTPNSILRSQMPDPAWSGLPPLLPPPVTAAGTRPRPAGPGRPAPVAGAHKLVTKASPPTSASPTVSSSATVNAVNHKLIFVSSTGGTASLVMTPPQSSPVSNLSLNSGDGRQRPQTAGDPGSDIYRPTAVLEKTSSSSPSSSSVAPGWAGVPGSARGRPKMGRPAAVPVTVASQAVRNATRVPTGIKIITHTVASGGTKVLTPSGPQSLLVLPNSGGSTNSAGIAIGAVRTGAGGGRVVTVSSGPNRALPVRPHQSLHTSMLTQQPAGNRKQQQQQGRPAASLIVLQKQGGGTGVVRSPAVVRPARTRPDGPASPIVAAKQTALASAVDPAKAGGGGSGSSVLSDILHATGIINQKTQRDGAMTVSSPVTRRPPAPTAPSQPAPPTPITTSTTAITTPAGTNNSSSPPPGERLKPSPKPPPPPAASGAAAGVVVAGQHTEHSSPVDRQPGSHQSPARTPLHVTFEEVAGLLSHATNAQETRQILQQAGIRLSQQPVQQGCVDDRVSEAGMELVGELDPQTGIFYPVTANGEGAIAIPASIGKSSGQAQKSPEA